MTVKKKSVCSRFKSLRISCSFLYSILCEMNCKLFTQKNNINHRSGILDLIKNGIVFLEKFSWRNVMRLQCSASNVF